MGEGRGQKDIERGRRSVWCLCGMGSEGISRGLVVFCRSPLGFREGEACGPLLILPALYVSSCYRLLLTS